MFGEEELTDTHCPKVDYKGRLTLPKDSKVEVGDKIIVLEWFDGYRIYNSERFYEIFKFLLEGKLTETIDKSRYVFSHAEEYIITSLPARVTIKALSNKSVHLIGHGDHYLAYEHKKGYR